MADFRIIRPAITFSLARGGLEIPEELAVHPCREPKRGAAGSLDAIAVVGGCCCARPWKGAAKQRAFDHIGFYALSYTFLWVEIRN
jgi:hypothetical protein